MNASYANGDPEKAFDLLVLFEESEQGIIREYDPNIKLLGAVNRDGVTCYLDALLFAMFARLGSFEAMLYNHFEDEPRKRLATLLRLWVNTLRVGRLVTTDIVNMVSCSPWMSIVLTIEQTKQLQLQLSACGWKDAANVRQQDASEAFSFITETLALPLLTLKMDIFHTGKEDVSDDHKFVHERLLEVAIPEEPADGTVITLEDCLETYFNNRIEVKRYLERRGTLNIGHPRLSVDSTKGSTSHIEIAEHEESQPSTPMSPLPLHAGAPTPPIQARNRAPSIIREHYVEEKGELPDISYPPEKEGSQTSRRRAGTLRKEVMMPAWQFFSLIPWYTDNIPKNDSQVAAHFSSTRPILGICLKRYSMLPNGRAVRRNTHIDIPLEIGLPHFIQDDAMSEDGPAFGNFKLSLRSVVCHRGVSVDSGHYISLVRSQSPHLRTTTGSTVSGEYIPDMKVQDKWMRLDDLAKERVTFVDVEEFLAKESPYLLFYQVTPIEGDPGNIADGEHPPSYTESESRYSELIKDSGASNEEAIDLGRSSLDGAVSLDGLRGRTSTSSERGQSVVFTDVSAGSTNLLTPGTDAGPNDPGSLLGSRRGSKVTKGSSRSRPSSQTEETRLSTSLSRFAGRLTKEKSADPIVTMDGVNEPVLKIPEIEAPESSRATEKLAVKRDKREKSRGRYGSQLVGKGKVKAEKPDRECAIM